MEQEARKNIMVGRVIGLLVFVVGAAMLVFVFFRAYYLFSSPPPGVAKGATAMSLSEAGLTLAAQIGLLFIMTLAGSFIAARGVQLYLGCPEPSSRS